MKKILIDLALVSWCLLVPVVEQNRDSVVSQCQRSKYSTKAWSVMSYLHFKIPKKVCENVLSALNGSSFFVTGLGGEKIDLFLGGDAVNEAPRLWLQETSLPSVFCLPTSSMILKRTVSYRFLRSCSSYVPMIHKR